MEQSAKRRLDSISRHLLPPETLANDLQLNFLSAADLNSSASFPVIIGGMVLDIHAKPYAPGQPGTTTPGKIQYFNGGVARNVAECMSKLGSKPFIISVVGLDMAGDLLLEYWKSSGLSTEGILKLQNISTPIVSNIYDANGELAAGVASVEAVETFITQDWLHQWRRNICSAPMLMIDANLYPRSLEAACRIAAEASIPVWFEPVSVSKSKRVASVVKYITCTSPNEDELIAMANTLSDGDEPCTFQRVEYNGNSQAVDSLIKMLKPAIRILLENGIKLVIVTLGSNGVFLCSREGPDFMKHLAKQDNSSSFGRQLYGRVNSSCLSADVFRSIKSAREGLCSYIVHFPALPASVVSLTGAGDCLVGGTITSICAGLDVIQSMAVGLATAKAAVETESNVPSEYSLARIADDARRILSDAKVFILD